MEFIKIKRDLTNVTGANISIKLNKEFMEAVRNDEDYYLRFPCNQDISYFSKDYINADYDKLHYIEDHNNDNNIIYVRKIRAKEYWDEIIKSAHGVAEPGLLFWDNVLDYGPDAVYDRFRPNGTNPCGEITLSEYDSCRLMVTNLFSFVDNPFTEEASFDFKKFYDVNYEAMRLSDNLVELELEYVQRILNKIQSDPESPEVKRNEYNLWMKVYGMGKAGRRTGLGFTALGDTLAALGLKYDSQEALDVIEGIMITKMSSELDATTDLAILRGTFEGYDDTNEYDEFDVGKNSFYEMIRLEFPGRCEKMRKFGRRNVSWSTLAPTGTVNKFAA